jgi:hypothetical protein
LSFRRLPRKPISFGGNLKVLCDEKITHHRMVIIHKKPSPGNRLTQKRHCEILGGYPVMVFCG